MAYRGRAVAHVDKEPGIRDPDVTRCALAVASAQNAAPKTVS
jgi:hypothetical protein